MKDLQETRDLLVVLQGALEDKRIEKQCKVAAVPKWEPHDPADGWDLEHYRFRIAPVLNDEEDDCSKLRVQLDTQIAEVCRLKRLIYGIPIVICSVDVIMRASWNARTKRYVEKLEAVARAVLRARRESAIPSENEEVKEDKCDTCDAYEEIKWWKDFVKECVEWMNNVRCDMTVVRDRCDLRNHELAELMNKYDDLQGAGDEDSTD